jgi:orotidine-5'-phosphate decarboxylase
MSALGKYARAVARGGLCVGLDVEPARLPAAVGGDSLQFLLGIIDATADLAGAYKVNAAFFEAQGAAGWQLLAQVRRAVPSDTLLILDGKRGDIESSNRAYARAAFDELGVDAVTVHPYLGLEPLQPFVERADRLTFVLCATSEGPALQSLRLTSGEPVYLWVARQVAALRCAHCGLVVGATASAELAAVRALAPGLPLLVPGVGAQGGAWPQGAALVNVSRSLLYASSGPDFAAAAREKAQALLAAQVHPDGGKKESSHV